MKDPVSIDLKPGERIDELQRNGYRIIQDPGKFCFGMDAVLLSAFAKARPGEKVLDLGTGTGVIPILMSARYPGAVYDALEIQPDMADMARRSVLMNSLSGSITVTCGDLREASALYGAGSRDAVTVNPPYMNEDHGLVNPEDSKAIARHELMCSLEDVIREASACLKSGGRFYMVHRPHRLAEIFSLMNKYHLEPKRMRLVHPRADAEAKMVLIEGSRSGGAWMKCEPPLVIYDSDGSYTGEIRDIYER